MSEDIWADDLLNRRDQATLLTQFLTRRIEERGEEGRTKSYVLNVDAKWGQGKTFFLKRFEQQLAIEGQVAVLVNAWKDDHADTPLISVMAAIDDALQPYCKNDQRTTRALSVIKENVGEIIGAVAKGAFKQAAKKIIGKSADEIVQIVSDGNASSTDGASIVAGIEESVESAVEKIVDHSFDALLSNFRARSKSVQSFKSNLAKLLAQISKTEKKSVALFVLVDELDRCRPQYAITLLEQIKHLFDINNVIFIVATDSEQLSFALGGTYGPQFDSQRYLRRFFDRRYIFPDPEIGAFITTFVCTS